MYQVGQSLIEKLSVEAPAAAQCIMNGSLAQHTGSVNGLNSVYIICPIRPGP